MKLGNVNNCCADNKNEVTDSKRHQTCAKKKSLFSGNKKIKISLIKLDGHKIGEI